MCYIKFHQCKYCNKEYDCNIQTSLCPTRNNDRDANMCDECRGKIEDELLHKHPKDLILDNLVGKFSDD